MPAAIVGREVELASVRDFVASVSDGVSALVLQGDAGAGKTTIWRAGVAAAEESGARVLQAVPAESETALSFSGIGDLLYQVLDEALAPLPVGQRRALSRALVLDDDEGLPPDPHAVGVAVLNALRALAEQRALIVAVDDVQWLDAASSAALAYAARRLRNERVGILLSRRVLLESLVIDELTRALPSVRLHNVDVGPLDVGALHHVVLAQLGIALPRPRLAEVHQATDGNPFYALEIVRMLQRTAVSVEGGQPLPVPDSLHDLVLGRLLALPEASRRFLFAAAAHAHPTISVTELASGVGRDAGLTPALEARIVELDRDRIHFTHPVLAAGAYRTVEPARRTETHARLAELLEDPEARAWQLAASVVEADERVASIVDEAARRARARGAPGPAALLLDRAGELTPDDRPEEQRRRAVDAAYLHFESGDSRRAEAQVREVIDPLAPGLERARALMVLAKIRTYEAAHEAAELFLQVVEEAEGDREVLARAHEGAASCCFWRFERLDAAVRHVEVAFTLAQELDDEALAADLLITQLGAETLLGRAAASSTLDRALALQQTASEHRVLDQPLVGIAEYWMWTDSHDRSRDTLIELLRRVDELGDESSRPYVLFLLGEVEVLSEQLELALERALAGGEAAEQSGEPLFAAYNFALEGLAQAYLGRPERARQATRRALELVPDGQVGLIASAARGHLHLSLGSPSDVVAELEPRVAFVRSEGIVEPGATRFVIDQIEALIEIGRRDDAVELLDWYEGNARRLERASALASCARCRGLLAAQSGSFDDALDAYEGALVWHGQVEIPLDRARTLLALGMVQRRAKRRSEARKTLGEALAVFERIGAAIWSERARIELQRISGRAATPGAMTPAEERVAALVAEGKTNREVGAALFLSDRTVEGHLSRVFGKLGVRSRTELARVLASGSGQVVESSNTGDSPVSPASTSP